MRERLQDTAQRNIRAIADAAPRLLRESDGNRIVDEVLAQSTDEGTIEIRVMSFWNAGQRWARNRAVMTSDQRDILVQVRRNVRGGMGAASSNQSDTVSLSSLARVAEENAYEYSDQRRLDREVEQREWPLGTSVVWSDTTFDRTPEMNGALTKQLTERSEAEGLLSAGYIESLGGSLSVYRRDAYGRTSRNYWQYTQAQCSMTVRHPKGTGSGWAGESGYDFSTIEPAQLANQALDKCLRSIDAVRIEPGRYTTILEPQAVAAFASTLLRFLNRVGPEQGTGPFAIGFDAALGRYRTKLGLKIVDERISIAHDPADIEMGVPTVPGLEKVTLIDRGVLVNMFNSEHHAINDLVETPFTAERMAFRMSGGTMSQEDMIAGTKRGLLVTRFSSLQVLDGASVLMSGVTRDGLWLIEDGKISKAVRNFRFTESPLFAFNNVEELGVPFPVWNPATNRRSLLNHPEMMLRPVIVPALKVRDFSFTSTIDAV
jgi:predicted Zn-dependent protease